MGQPTVCELNCRLVPVSAANTAAVRDLLYPTVEVDESQVAAALSDACAVVLVAGQVQPRHKAALPASASTVPAPLRACGTFLQQRLGILNAWAGDPPPPHPGGGVAWATRSRRLALAHAPSGAALVYDVAACPSLNGHGVPPPLREARWVLTHALQQQASCLAWRPQYSTMLAVGAKGCVLLWALGRSPFPGSAGQASGGSARAAVLHFRQGARVSALAWSPDGRLLAGCSCDSNRIVVWDAALCTGASLRTRLAPHALLSWSPCGNYLFGATTLGGFTLWETCRWAHRSWDAPPGCTVAAAAWAPGGRALLLAMGGAGGGLVALHLVGQPPALEEQMLPVALPEVSDRDSAGAIADMAWDPQGRRLAVALQQPHPAAGGVALYATAVDPVITATFLGVVRPPWGADEEGGGGGGGDAPRRGADLRVSFAEALGDGAGRLSALLSLRRVGSDAVALVPLYF